MRLKLFDSSRKMDCVLWLRDRSMAGVIIGICSALVAMTVPIGAQTLPDKAPDASQPAPSVNTTNPTSDPELNRERFRRQSAEAAQKQLEALAAQLREQLAKEIAARRAAEVVAAELLSRTELEDRIDTERQRLKGKARTGTALRAGADGAQLKALVRELKRKLKAAERARKLAEAQLKILSGGNQR